VNFGIDNLKHFISQNKEHIIVLADKHTLDMCYPLLEQDLPHFIVPYGEGYKSIQSCEYIWKKLMEFNATRQSILLCLGGGIICDMGAFAGACYQRGMRTVLCPTSLLAMVDASVGGKTGVNFLGFKNYIGVFKHAEDTFICPEFLDTLPECEMINGHVEMLKHGIIADKSHYDVVKLFFFNHKTIATHKIIAESISIKEKHVMRDFEDQGVRKRLNFGHTIGHAIESWSLANSDENEELSHGVSVALGMIAESYISHKIANLSDVELDEISIELQGIVNSVNRDLPGYNDLQKYLLRDKKNEDNRINFSLISAIGVCRENYFVDEDVIEESIEYLNRLK
jgi:3-dehydroquinate synthase